MTRRNITMLLVIGILLVLAFARITQAFSGTGSGTEEDPYIITNVNQLQEMNDDLDAWYELGNDIDASVTSGWNGGNGFLPIGDWMNKFGGHLNGREYIISGLFINHSNSDQIGLVSSTKAGSEIENVGLVIADITGGESVGALVGRNYEGIITNCYSTGSVYGGSPAGGLVGSNWGTIAHSCSYANVDGGRYVGGLVGRNYDYYGIITNSYSTGSVYGNQYVGGLVGRNEDTITNSYSTGSVHGSIGLGNDVGGLVGHNEIGTINNCYSTGSVSEGEYFYTGGLVGYAYRAVCNDSFWDKVTSGWETSSGGTGKTTEEMKQQATFSNWDFNNVWDITENQTYPFLRGMPVIRDVPEETISKPGTPTGEINPVENASYTYTTSGAESNLEHTVEYQFAWDDGSSSSWSTETSSSHSWSSTGERQITVTARCQTHTDKTNISDPLPVTVVPPPAELYMFLKQPLTTKTCWTEIKGGAGNIEQNLSTEDISEPKASRPIGNYLGTKTGELSLTSGGVHPEIEGERITGQTSKLGLGQNSEVDLISFIPVLSTVRDYVDHIQDEPLEQDKRRRYLASVLEGSVHIGGSQPQSVKLAIDLEMKGAASGQADYYTQILTRSSIDLVLLGIPVGELFEIGSSSYVEKLVFDNLLGMGANITLCLALDSRFRGFSEACLGLGTGNYISIDHNPIGWSIANSSDFNLGVITTDKLLPTFWSAAKWLPQSDGTQNIISSSIIYKKVEQQATYQQEIEVEVGSDIPLTVLLRTYAETAGFAAAEARIDEVTITISVVDHPGSPSLVIKSDPEWSFPTFSRFDPYFERSDLLAAASANDLTYGAISVVDSIAGLNTPDGSSLVFADCNSVSGLVIPVFLPETPERHIKLKLDVLMSRPLDSNEHAEVEVGLTNQDLHEVLWSLDFNDISLSSTPTVETGFSLHTGIIELTLDVGHFESGTAFLTLAGYVEPNDCSMGFVAYDLSIDPKFVLGDFDLDADVDFADFAEFANKWLVADCNEVNLWCQGCDFDENGGTDANDLPVFMSNWLWSRHIPGDLNFSGGVNFLDFSGFANQWMADCGNPDWCDGCDFDESGKVDVNDLGEFVEYWLLGTIP